MSVERYIHKVDALNDAVVEALEVLANTAPTHKKYSEQTAIEKATARKMSDCYMNVCAGLDDVYKARKSLVMDLSIKHETDASVLVRLKFDA